VLALSALMTGLWLIAAAITVQIIQHELDEVFDSALQETGQRILQLAVIDVLGREEAGGLQKLTPLGPHSEFFTYILRDDKGRVLIASHNADAAQFPLQAAVGFMQTQDFRFYSEAAVRGTVTLTIAEPLAHRQGVAREVGLGLMLPLLGMIPLSILAIAYGMGVALRPLSRLRAQVQLRGAQDLAPLNLHSMPSELQHMGQTINQLFARLSQSFDAERSFAANAAHELRTPLAGAIAQVQRLRAQTADPNTAQRATDIETTLQRLTRLAERLLQFSRAEGARLMLEAPADALPAVVIVVQDFIRSSAGARISLSLPDCAVPSRLDPDAIGIMLRNLIENALHYGRGIGADGEAGGQVQITLHADGLLHIDNPCPPVTQDVLASLAQRFVRGKNGSGAGFGTGLGLSIVRTIADRTDAQLALFSPIPNTVSGFRAALHLGPAPLHPIAEAIPQTQSRASSSK
jgi:two-component system OmpR family sensor kinase